MLDRAEYMFGKRSTHMHFDIANIQWIIIGVPHYPSENAGLVTLMRSCNAVCLTTMVCSGANDDAKNRIVVGFCIL